MAPLTNPTVSQGTLNSLRGSWTWSAFPGLNVTAPYLGREGISLTFEGESTVYINTMTGAVTSPEPYLKITAELALLKTQSLSNAYKTQIETMSTLGDATCRADALALGLYQFSNCSLQNVRALRFNGEDAGYVVTVGGVYYINSALWGST